ncbi:MAG: BatD family protein [bacterium]|nr:BatD family protein [bacterium]
MVRTVGKLKGNDFDFLTSSVRNGIRANGCRNPFLYFHPCEPGSNKSRFVFDAIKLLFLSTAMFLISGIHAASLSLRLVDTDYQELQQVAVGQPFILEVTMNDVRDEVPLIAGIEHLRIVGRSTRVSTINEKSTVHYDYIVHVDEQEDLKIGPAMIMHNGTRVVSNVITIKVGESLLYADKAKKKENQEQILLRFLVDNEQVVVGQKINCTLRFYYASDAVRLRQINHSEYGGFKKTKEEGPYAGTENIDGQNYNYAEWRWQLYPEEPGKKMLPGCAADFDIISTRNNILRSFGSFFSSQVERKRVYSNALHLYVDSLPPYNEPVQGIGSFKHLRTFLKPSIAKEGEGMVLTVELEGEGNSNALDQFVLQGMPEELRYYDSKKYSVDSQKEGELSKKCFEFIVQGLKVGDWKIPAQIFTYFDVDKKQYQILKSAPIITSIIRGISPVIVKEDKTQDNVVSKQVEQKIDEVLAPINYDGPWRPVREWPSLPFRVFVLLSVLPVLSGLFLVLLSFLKGYYRKNGVHVRAKYAFLKARKELKQAESTHNVTALYGLFMRLIAHRCMISEHELCVSDIEQLLANKKVSSDTRVNWNHFFNQLTECVFGKKGTIESNNNLFKQAEEWIGQLEKLF